MISADDITFHIGKKALFEDVSIQFTKGNCYGLIGTNGTGKSTFLKILSDQLEPTNGNIAITPGQRLSFLEQDRLRYDEFSVLDTVTMGNQHLYDIMKEKDALYAKEDFTSEDDIKAAGLGNEFADMNGWDAESDAANLLNGLGAEPDYHHSPVEDLPGALKVKALPVRTLFGNPDILLLSEPTNHLDLEAIDWLEEFLVNFENTIIVVSHDRYFLDKVCTMTADIDYDRIQLYTGSYNFWHESSQLIVRQMKKVNRKRKEEIKGLKELIRRFSANTLKGKQATSRKRALEKIEFDEMKPSGRRYPFIDFHPNREIDNEVLTVTNLSKTTEGVRILNNISFTLNRTDKMALVGPSERVETVFFQILSGQVEPDSDDYKWGITTTAVYFPGDNMKDFSGDETIVEWLTQYPKNKDAAYVRGFLGRMLSAGDNGVEKAYVLSGGEKVRVVLSKLMITGANVLFLNESTDHLDMESITTLSDGLTKFPSVLLFPSRNHQIVKTTTNRIMEIINSKLVDETTTYDAYLGSDEMARKRFTCTVSADGESDDRGRT